MAPVSTPKSTPQNASKENETVFGEGENVLCFHGKQLYEARVQAIDSDPEIPKYYVHYMGWNSKWDEWVDQTRVLKYTDSNLELKKELLRSRSSSKASKRKAESSAANSSVSEGQPSAKAKSNVTADGEIGLDDSSKSETESPEEAPQGEDNEDPDFQNGDQTVELEDQYTMKVEVQIKIPDELKSYLVDDWDYVTRQRKLVNLPARNTVEQILNHYVKSKATKSSNSKANSREAAAGDIAKGFIEYFNVMLGSQLLYKFETEQHAEILKTQKDVPTSQIYGSIHLLRLFVKLGGALSYSLMDDRAMGLLMHHINDFLSYMKKNASTLFMIQDYVTVPPEYHRKSI